MTNNVQLFKHASLPDVQSFQRALAEVQSDLDVSAGGNYLKLDKKTGYWVFGAQENEVQEGSEWAINPLALKTGFIAWGKGEVAAKHTRAIGNALLLASELPPVPPVAKRGWEKVIVMTLVCLNGEDQGTQVEYEQTSYGARKAFSEIVSALQAQSAADPTKIVPVVTLDSESYEHKEYGTIWNPIFNIKRWVSMDGDNTPPPPAVVSQEKTPKTTETVTRRRRPAVA